VTWSGQSSDAPYGQSLITSNWWWVGAIHITFNNGANSTDAYVPQQATSDYPYSDQGYVLVTCAGTQKHLDDVITTSDGYYWACITSDNPVGHITYYQHWYGYVYTTGADGHISSVGSGWGPNGVTVPLDVTGTVTVPECG
jgi:hypothetical protein